MELLPALLLPMVIFVMKSADIPSAGNNLSPVG